MGSLGGESGGKNEAPVEVTYPPASCSWISQRSAVDAGEKLNDGIYTLDNSPIWMWDRFHSDAESCLLLETTSCVPILVLVVASVGFNAKNSTFATHSLLNGAQEGQVYKTV